VSAQLLDRRPPHRVALPLPAGTALCLACWWADASGTEAPTRALAHTRQTSHPTIAVPEEA
jgi:hypothetical protein